MRTLCLIALFVLCVAGAARGGIIVPACHSDYTPIPGAALGDVRLSVDLSVEGGIATFTFSNISTGLEDSVVFKEIVIDTIDNDTDTAILWNAQIAGASAGVSYSIDQSNGLPGFNSLTNEDPALVELQAKNKKAMEIGQYLQVSFMTSLADGSGVEDYFAAFGAGDDTGIGSIGFHGISASIINGQSLSGVNMSAPVPEPALAGLLAAGGVALVLRRRARRG